jgi:hypothetical protein
VHAHVVIGAAVCARVEEKLPLLRSQHVGEVNSVLAAEHIPADAVGLHAQQAQPHPERPVGFMPMPAPTHPTVTDVYHAVVFA